MTPCLGIVHAVLLCGLSWWSAARLFPSRIEQLCAAFLLVWCNLAYTALLLAAGSALGSKGLYFAVSVGAAVLLHVLLCRLSPGPVPVEACPPENSSRFDVIVRRVLWVTLVLATLGSGLICAFYIPNNWDSCTYRFSRAFFYLAQGNLLHFGNPLDPRLLFYPLNGALFYLFFASYQFPAGGMYVVTGLAWVFAGLGAYSVARRLGASRAGSFIAAWICWLSPSVLSQAASTNDEVLAAVPLLLALGFALEWLSTHRTRYALFAGIGAGLACGSKMHWVFYALVAALGAVLLAVRAVRSPGLRTDLARRIPSVMAAATIALPLASAFLVCNYISSGRFTDAEYNNAILNRPFRLSLASEKIRINTAELFLSPIPDLVPPVHHGERRNAYAEFNRFFMKCCFSSLVETTKRSPEGYLFEGPADPEGAAPTEYTVWLGFMPHLLLAVLTVGLLTGKLSPATLWVAAAFFGWHITYAIANRFIPTASVYYSFPAALAFAAFGPAWDYSRSSRHWSSRLLLVGFLAVFSTHLLLGANLLAFGGLRNLQFAWHKTPAPEMHSASAGVVETIRAASRIYVPYTHWEVLYWNFMRFNPAAKYSTGVSLRLPSPDTTMLLSLAREGGADLFPARLPPIDRGLLYAGDADSQPIFAQGGPLETGRPGRRRYMLLPIWWNTGPAGRIQGLTMRISRPTQTIDCCVGIDASDGIEYRYELQSTTTGAHIAHEWTLAGSPDSGLAGTSNVGFDTFVVQTRLRRQPGTIVRTVRRLNAGAYEIAKDEDQSGDHR